MGLSETLRSCGTTLFFLVFLFPMSFEAFLVYRINFMGQAFSYICQLEPETLLVDQSTLI